MIGGSDAEGAVIVSQLDEPVEYSPTPVGPGATWCRSTRPSAVPPRMNAYTQTVGVYPEALKDELRDQLPLLRRPAAGLARLRVSVTLAGPQDAIEPLRRMCKWIVDEVCDPTEVFPMWDLA